MNLPDKLSIALRRATARCTFLGWTPNTRAFCLKEDVQPELMAAVRIACLVARLGAKLGFFTSNKDFTSPLITSCCARFFLIQERQH